MRFDYSESTVLASCLDLLSVRDVMAWRNNSGATLAEYKGKKRLIRYGLKDSSDIFSILRGGRFLAVETKRPAVPELGQRAGKLRPGQAAFLRAVNQQGGVGLCVASVDDLAVFLDRLRDDPSRTFTDIYWT